MDYSKYTFNGKERLLYGVTGLLLGAGAMWVCYHCVYALPGAIPVAILFLRMRKNSLREKRKETLLRHFKEFLTILNSSLRAGNSVENGVIRSVTELASLYGKEDDMVKEIRQIAGQIRNRVPVEQLFRNLGERSGLDDIRFFGEVLEIAKRTGGSVSAMMEKIWKTLWDKMDTLEEISTVTAAKRFEQTIMSLMPVGIILYLRFGFPGFAEKLYGNITGIFVMTVCVFLYILAFFIGRKIVRIEV